MLIYSWVALFRELKLVLCVSNRDRFTKVSIMGRGKSFEVLISNFFWQRRTNITFSNSNVDTKFLKIRQLDKFSRSVLMKKKKFALNVFYERFFSVECADRARSQRQPLLEDQREVRAHGMDRVSAAVNNEALDAFVRPA